MFRLRIITSVYLRKFKKQKEKKCKRKVDSEEMRLLSKLITRIHYKNLETSFRCQSNCIILIKINGFMISNYKNSSS